MIDWKRHLNFRRGPDEEIGEPDDLYLRRWWIFPKNRFMNFYLHNFMRSDEDRALHDHPWLFNVSVILRECYIEHMPGGRSKLRKPWRPVFRLGTAPHRVELLPDSSAPADKPRGKAVWTLFIIGPKVREWGFFCPKGWVHNGIFNTPTATGSTIGQGCE